MNDPLDPRIEAFLKRRGDLAPVGVRCVVIPLGNGRFYIEPNDESQRQTSVIQDGEYIGFVDFIVNRNAQGRDVVTVPPSEVGALTPDELPSWIPSVQVYTGFGGIVGSPVVLVLQPAFNVLDTSLVPRLPNLQYPWDETSTFTVTVEINSPSDPAGHTWTNSSLPDNSFVQDSPPYEITWTDSNEVTTFRWYVYAPQGADNVLIYQILYSYQFELTGSDPISTVVEYQLPNTLFA